MCSVYQIGLSYNLCMTLNNTNLLYLFLKVSKKLETTKCYYRCAELKFMKIKRSMLQINYLRIYFLFSTSTFGNDRNRVEFITNPVFFVHP